MLTLLLLAFAHGPTASRADESAVQNRPATTSVEKMHGSLKRGFEKKPDRPVGPFRHRLRTVPPFLRDAHLGVRLRTCMIRNSFEAYRLWSQIPNLDFITGHVTKMKTRGSRDFISMLEAAGERPLVVGWAIFPGLGRRRSPAVVLCA